MSVKAACRPEERNTHIEVVGFTLPAILKSRSRRGLWLDRCVFVIPVKPDIASLSNSTLLLVGAKCLEIRVKLPGNISGRVSVYVPTVSEHYGECKQIVVEVKC